MTFHSGDPLTAADVKSSIERVTAETSASSRKSSLAVIAGVETPDDATVVVTLSQPSISLPYNLSYVWIVNDAAGDITGKADGTGPYELQEWRRGSALSLVPFEGYWGEAPQNGGVVFQYFTDATAQNNALLTGAVDIITSVQSPDALSLFLDNDDFTVSEGASTTKELLAFNDRVAPFDDVQVRKALSRAIDKERLLNSIWGDYGTLIGSFVPPTDPWYVDLTGVDPYDPESAKAMLAEAGLRRRLQLHPRHARLRPAPDRRAVRPERARQDRRRRSRSTSSPPTSGTPRSTSSTTSRRRCRSTSTTATSSSTATPTSTGATTTPRSSA